MSPRGPRRGAALAASAFPSVARPALAQTDPRLKAVLEPALAASEAPVLPSFEKLHSSLHATAGDPKIPVPMGWRRADGGPGAPAGITLTGMPGAEPGPEKPS